MRLRAQPPVHSPLRLGAIGSGLRALAAGGAGADARVEAALRAAYGAAEILLTDSGTSALALALGLAARERPGPVALPAYCCYDVATATDAAGVAFVLYDVEPATLGPDLDSLRRALAAGAGSIVVAHLYGVPVNLPEVEALAREFGAVVIEDAAQGAGIRFGGRPAGALGRYGVLSFGRGKGVTGGRGGALLANAADAAPAVREAGAKLRGSRGTARDVVAVAAQWLLARPALYGLPASLPFLRLGETIYRRPWPAARAPAFALGVLSGTLGLAEREAHVRRANARRLLEAMGPGGPLRGIVGWEGAEPGFLRLPVLVAEGGRARVRSAEARRLGVWPGYPRSLADLEGFGPRRCDREGAVPGARELAERLVTLPTHGVLGLQGVAALRQWIGTSVPERTEGLRR